MEIRREGFRLDCLRGERRSALRKQNLLPGEIAGVSTELISMRGPLSRDEAGVPDVCVVLISLGGAATVKAAGAVFDMSGETIVRPPYAKEHVVEVAGGQEVHFLRIGLSLDGKDRAAIEANAVAHGAMLARRFADCPAYTEPIKSAKTKNRMLLLEGEVPRFGAGTVETTGPDEVGAHEHAMLEQLFLGLKGCRCTVHADGAEAPLEENCLLHVPLGSRHGVSVESGDRLSYVWLDFFRTLADQSWLTTAHALIPPGGRP